MELRKVQRTGGGTFLVSLPKEWAERNGLDRGSLVAVSERLNGRLVVDPKYGVERAQQTAIIKPTPYLVHEIIGKYLLGYDIIRVEAKDRISPEDRESVKQRSSRLIGLEIIEEDYSGIVMQCLLEPSSFPPEKILRREYSIASSMHRDAVTALIEGDVPLAKNVIARDDEVDRLYFLLVRILRTVIQNPYLSEKLEILPIDCLDYRLAASLVESIGDQSTQIVENAIRLGGSKPAEKLYQLFLNLHKIAYESHENAMKALFSRDISLAESIRTKREIIASVFHEIETIVHAEPIEFAPYILAASSVCRIYDYSLDIADLGMPRPV
jgi:phosphate uptake regulator